MFGWLWVTILGPSSLIWLARFWRLVVWVLFLPFLWGIIVLFLVFCIYVFFCLVVSFVGFGLSSSFPEIVFWQFQSPIHQQQEKSRMTLWKHVKWKSLKQPWRPQTLISWKLVEANSQNLPTERRTMPKSAKIVAICLQHHPHTTQKPYTNKFSQAFKTLKNKPQTLDFERNVYNPYPHKSWERKMQRLPSFVLTKAVFPGDAFGSKDVWFLWLTLLCFPNEPKLLQCFSLLPQEVGPEKSPQKRSWFLLHLKRNLRCFDRVFALSAQLQTKEIPAAPSWIEAPFVSAGLCLVMCVAETFQVWAIIQDSIKMR